MCEFGLFGGPTMALPGKMPDQVVTTEVAPLDGTIEYIPNFATPGLHEHVHHIHTPKHGHHAPFNFKLAIINLCQELYFFSFVQGHQVHAIVELSAWHIVLLTFIMFGELMSSTRSKICKICNMTTTTFHNRSYQICRFISIYNSFIYIIYIIIILIPSLKFRLPYLINVHQSINPFLLKSRGMKKR